MVVSARRQTTLAVGADAVINSAEEDVAARLLELHGAVPAGGGRAPRPGTDLFLDAAGGAGCGRDCPCRSEARRHALHPSRHKKPASVDFGAILSAELTTASPSATPGAAEKVIVTFDGADWVHAHQMR